MPSHRRERLPRHRAHRRTESPSRRVSLNDVLAAPEPALVEAGAPDLTPTVPIMLTADAAAAGGALAGSALIGSVFGSPASAGPVRAAPGLGGPAAGSGIWMRTVVRRLLVTPWFAASTGFVIAAGMWLHSPHASISFPPAIGTVHCQLHNCQVPGGKGSGSLTSSVPGQRLPIRHVHKRPAAGQSATARQSIAGLRFTLTVLWHGHNSFGAVITISGRRSLGSWQLAFRLPGTRIENVFGAEWVQLASSDGGTASPFEGQFGQPADQGGVSFRVFGTGSLGRVTHCTFDGAACSFKVTAAGPDGQPGAGQPGGGYGGGPGGGGLGGGGGH